MRACSRFISLALISSLSACATIVSGSSQRVAVDTSPEGADCRVSQGGMPIGEIQQTPGAIMVQRGNGVVQMSCTKPGYRTAQQADGSGVNGWVFGNLVIGGLVGVVIDLATGAAYHYGPNMMLALDGAPGYAPPIAYAPGRNQFAYGASAPASSAAPTAYDVEQADNARFYAATGHSLPPGHGFIRLPPATTNGDPTYIWPTSDTN